MGFILFPSLGFYLLSDLKLKWMCLSTSHIQGGEELRELTETVLPGG